MFDFIVVLLSAEILYIFLSKEKKELGFLLMPLAILAKQSLGLFIFPLMAYFFIINFKDLLKNRFLFLILFFYLIILSFNFRSYIELKNPLGGLYNNIFKSELFPKITPKESDLRWGPLNIKEIIYWPFIAQFSNRYIEFFSDINYSKTIIYPLFLMVPYVLSFYLIVKRKNIFLNLIIFLSFIFWSKESGYGRYHLGLTFLSILILFYQFKDNIKLNIPNIITWMLLIIVGIYSFVNIRLDYGMRNFFLINFFPPKVEKYYVDWFINGFKNLGRDRYRDIFNEIDNKIDFSKYDGITVINRGVSTFYAFLISKKYHLPVFSYLSDKETKRLIKFKNLNIKNKIKTYLNLKNPLVLSVKDFSNDIIYKTDLENKYKCQFIDRDKLVNQFFHPNYFNYVNEFECYIKN